MTESRTNIEKSEAAREAQIQESCRKLAELEKDKPLWEAERHKREAVAAAKEQARQALMEERHRTVEEEHRRAAEAAAQAAEDLWCAWELNHAIEKQWHENRQVQHVRWSPWNQSHAFLRYEELSKLFDSAKFMVERPADPLMLTWPVLSSPFTLDISNLTWQHVEAFFVKAKKQMRKDIYKTFIHTSNLRFHPDTWQKQGVFTSLNITVNAKLERACIVVLQQLTHIWKESREL